MVYRLRDNDPELKPWEERLAELAGEPDDIDEMLAEIEARAAEAAENEARGQLELFGALLSTFAKDKRRPSRTSTASPSTRTTRSREPGRRSCRK